MDEKMKKRFTIQKISDLLSDNVNTLPTIICEMENPSTTEAVRKNVLFAIDMGVLVPFTTHNTIPPINEELDHQKDKINYGEMYIDVNIN